MTKKTYIQNLTSLAFLISLIAISSICNISCSSGHKDREMQLKQRLHIMRQMVTQYTKDQGELPSSLDDLAKKGYLFEILPDPLTGKVDWETKIGGDAISKSSRQGIVEIRSNAKGKGSDGTPYSDY
jgi:competence protein ComGC